MVAPPTSGQSHAVESDFTDPFSQDEVPLGHLAGSSEQAPDPAGRRVPGEPGPSQRPSPEAPLTDHEQWILSQRPPHWG